MDLSLPWLDSAPSTVSSSRVKTMGHDRQSSISSTKSRKSLASRLPSLGKSKSPPATLYQLTELLNVYKGKVKVHIDSENQVPAPPPPTPANPPKPSSLASTSAPRSNAGLPARKAPRKPVPSLIPEETDEDRSRATAIVAQTAASRRKPFENLTNRPESNKSPKDYTSSKHVPKRQKSKALPPIRLSEGPTSPGDEVVAGQSLAFE
ncbi:hypothetical protein SISSUDRAFT_896245 [Sistotremastrum suecicum HHB10207 ss-3]|uniref:Uncharacterized protein n=1 Tax=Sistotremastrum suecicum HHB10207 ss-3 TaxID=1314776 RepID=A0A166HEN1_9AGAM|nr:hypothetical protein SISSUDRAFT_896245 [Sistotremastrum suecicum HHB10207 ss-3]